MADSGAGLYSGISTRTVPGIGAPSYNSSPSRLSLSENGKNGRSVAAFDSGPALALYSSTSDERRGQSAPIDASVDAVDVNRSSDACFNKPMPVLHHFDARKATAELDKIIDDLLNFSSSSGLQKNRTFTGDENRDAPFDSRLRPSADQRSCSSTPKYRNVNRTTEFSTYANSAKQSRPRDYESELATGPKISATSWLKEDDSINSREQMDYYLKRWHYLRGGVDAANGLSRLSSMNEMAKSVADERSGQTNGSSAHARLVEYMRSHRNNIANSTFASSSNHNANRSKSSVSPPRAGRAELAIQTEDPALSKVKSSTSISTMTANDGRRHDKDYQKVRIECFEEVESIALEPIGKGVQDLAARNATRSSQSLSHSGTVAGNTPKTTGFVEQEIEVVVLQPIGRGVRDLGRAGSRSAASHSAGVRAASASSALRQPLTAMQMSAYSRHLGPAGLYPTASRQAQVASDVSRSYTRSGQRAGAGAGNSVVDGSLVSSPSVVAPPHFHHTLPMPMYTLQRRSSGLQAAQNSPGRTSSSFASSLALAMHSSSDDVQRRVQMVQDRSRWWYKPTMPRDEIVQALLSMRTGSFLVRKSGTYAGAFGLAIRVDPPPTAQPQPQPQPQNAESDMVRHFLLERSGKGVRVRGFPIEPTFTSLAALIYQHTVTPLGLPCCLVLPDYDPAPKYSEVYQSNMSLLSIKGPADGSLAKAQVAGLLSSIDSLATQPSDGPTVSTTLVYIGAIDVETLSGPQAISRAFVELQNAFRRGLGASLTEVKLTISSQGVTITDVNRRLFFRKHLPIPTILFCGTDPEDRKLTDLTRKGGTSAKLFGIVARKQTGPLSGTTVFENMCYLFAELAQSIPIAGIVSFIGQFVNSTASH